MKRLRSLLILVAFALMPLLAFATNEGGEKSEGLDIPKVVLEHLSDSYGKALEHSVADYRAEFRYGRLVRRYGGKSA